MWSCARARVRANETSLFLSKLCSFSGTIIWVISGEIPESVYVEFLTWKGTKIPRTPSLHRLDRVWYTRNSYWHVNSSWHNLSFHQFPVFCHPSSLSVKPLACSTNSVVSGTDKQSIRPLRPFFFSELFLAQQVEHLWSPKFRFYGRHERKGQTGRRVSPSTPTCI